MSPAAKAGKIKQGGGEWESGRWMSCKDIHLYAGHKQNKRGSRSERGGAAWPQTLPQEMQSRMQRIPRSQISTWGFSKPGAISSGKQRGTKGTKRGSNQGARRGVGVAVAGSVRAPEVLARQSYVIDSKSFQLATGEYKWLDNGLAPMLLFNTKNYHLLYNIKDI